MLKEQVTDKEAICLLIVFMMGTTLILGSGGEAKNDAWISTIVSLFMFIPMLLIFSRVLSLYQGKDLFDILVIIFGKVVGRVFSVIYIWYAFHLGALVLRNFGEFINTIAMPETPMFVPLLCMGVTCIIAVRLGIEVLGRTTTYFLPIVFFIVVVVQILGLPEIHMSYLKPILGKGIAPVLKGGFSTFSFPFAETVLFIGIFSALKTKKSPIKVYLWGILISSFIITMITIRNITVLGNMLGSFYFPSYETVSQTSIGDFIQRIEVTVSIVFVFGVLIKSSICLLVACKGIGKFFKLNDYRSIVIQTGLLMIYFSYTAYDNIMEMKYWAFKVYQYYAFPMQVILPIIIWIFAEIKVKKNNWKK
ncbi:GerAB/ArcD/ProY family transporter [Acetivibrio cellulolyticus]|uniref:GerAB/ArcD/ProY family transporter n=1 Tax=Acetivibrio cellulolyticus TaxID=35830 RepID=UPI0001E2E2A3|nr:endospore germination permease [Acetivibrio cellulolyticus]